MGQVLARIRKFAIFCHRWMGLAFCVLFAWWFASGIFMMYWDFPSVSQGDRLDHADPIDASRIRFSPEEGFAKLGVDASPASVQLAMLDGRPAYRFTMAGGRGRGVGAAPPRGSVGRDAPASMAGSGNSAKTSAGDIGGGFRGGRRSGTGGRGTNAQDEFGNGFGRGFGRGRRSGRRTAGGGVTPSNASDSASISTTPQDGVAGSGRSPAAPRPEVKKAPSVAGKGAPTPALRSAGGRAGGQTIVYADDGSVQGEYSNDLLLRLASRWTGQAGSSARVQEVTAVDQWTVGLRSQLPLWKYTFPDGQQLYLNQRSGEVVQYTTLGSRIGAELGPIPHWIYYTPLRVKQKLWSNLIIYASGIGTVMALLGLCVGISLYSPSRRYVFGGAASGVPYRGKKRLHMTLGLFFGIVACTWAFSGMLSMDPFPVTNRRGPGGNDRTVSFLGRIQAVLRARRLEMSEYAAKPPLTALAELGNLRVKQLDFTSFDDQPVYVAALNSHETRIVPVHGDPHTEYDRERIFEMVGNAARPYDVVDKHVLTQYDRYYLDRHRQQPLPVLFIKLNDPQNTQLYIDQRTARLVGEHSDASSFVTRWLYHGLHSMDFPWLYNHRPAWDIVVLTLMLGGLALCVTAIILAWGLLRRKLTLSERANAPS